jgi:predicted RNase H-like nuclease (RuvC/YqgF family)
MNMKTEEEKEQKDGGRSCRFPRDVEGAPSDFSSTFQSLDFAPKEYETQLQLYEAEVRNHIKVE